MLVQKFGVSFYLKKYTFIQQGHIKLIKSDIVMFPISKQIRGGHRLFFLI